MFPRGAELDWPHMAQATAIRLTGDDLRVTDVWTGAVDRTPAELSDASRDRMRAARELVERTAHGAREHTYGVNTGFGKFVSRSIPEELTEELQVRLLRSHACGVGEPYPDEIVRAALLLRANALAKGTSGARVELVEALLACLNAGLLPYVPSRGSVGASGDLAPLAHLALPLIGEGKAWHEGELLDGDEALAAVAADRPDAILLDIMMPRLSGWKVAAALLADETTDQIPIIFITARAGLSDRIRAFELGAHGYLTKPFDPAVLPATITKVLDQIERGERDADLAETLAALRAQQESATKLRQ